MRRLTQRQETFCLKYFELGNASEAARIAKYSPKTAAVIGRENLLKPKIIERIAGLRQVAEDASIANVVERKQVLTEITRGKLSQFTDESGVIDRSKLDSSAIQGVDEQRTAGGRASIIKLKLHSPIQAIDLLNKMDKIYSDGLQVNIDNRDLTINVLTPKAKKQVEKLIEGERTE